MLKINVDLNEEEIRKLLKGYIIEFRTSISVLPIRIRINKTELVKRIDYN